MKKSLLLILAISLSIGLVAQKKVSKTQTNQKLLNYSVEKKTYTGSEVLNLEGRKVIKSNPPKDQALIGDTEYDLQSNSAIDDRVSVHDDGTISAAWIMGTNPPASPDRGTGFNYFDGTSWGPQPTERIEDERVGWPSIGALNGHDYVVTHTATVLYETANSSFGANDWSSAIFNSSTNPYQELIWPRMAIAGPDGQTIHIVAVSDNPGDTLAYFRSTDGGQTWVDDGIFVPGFSDKYANFAGDAYAIDAKGNTVVIANFAGYDGDLGYAKSTDNGESWTYHTVIDFPDQFEPYDGTEDVDADGDGEADTLTTCFGAGDIIIDHDDVVHVAFSIMRQTNANNYYPYFDGIGYWNDTRREGDFSLDESWGYNSTDPTTASELNLLGDHIDTIAMAPDVDGNDTIHEWIELDPGQIALGIYDEGVSTMPTFGLDDNNNLYMLYMTAMETEDYVDMGAAPNPQHYRHVFYNVRAAATGEWRPIEEAEDLISGSLDLKENAYPCIGRSASNQMMHYTFQSDEEPGTLLKDDSDPITTNYQIYNSFPVIPENVKEMSKDNQEFSVYPNPVKNSMTLSVEENAQIKIYNIVGSEILTIEEAESTQTINLSHLPEGSYIVKVADSKGVSTQKIIKK